MASEKTGIEVRQLRFEELEDEVSIKIDEEISLKLLYNDNVMWEKENISKGEEYYLRITNAKAGTYRLTWDWNGYDPELPEELYADTAPAVTLFSMKLTDPQDKSFQYGEVVLDRKIVV